MATTTRGRDVAQLIRQQHEIAGARVATHPHPHARTAPSETSRRPLAAIVDRTRHALRSIGR